MSFAVLDIISDVSQLDALVLDANAFIRGHGLDLFHKSKRLVTVQEVLEEVRDAKAQALLASLPFELEVLSPSADAIKSVVEFARQTGDFRSLSKTDLRVVALTYELFSQSHGHPPQHRKLISLAKNSSVVKAKTTSIVVDESTITPDLIVDLETAIVIETDSDFSQSGTNNSVDDTFLLTESLQNANLTEEKPIDNASDSVVEITTQSTNTWAAMARNAQSLPTKPQRSKSSLSHFNPAVTTQLQRSPIAVDLINTANVESEPFQVVKKSSKTETSSIANRVSVENESRQMANEDDGEGWISVDNISSSSGFEVFNSYKVRFACENISLFCEISIVFLTFVYMKEKKKSKSKNAKDTEEHSPARVACFTTDFSMQNILLQLGLKVMASDGMFVRSARQWVLRCLGCRTVHTKDLDRLFCSQCGLHHLQRIAASVDEGGALRLHLKKNYRMDTTGMQYSLPAPGKQGRFQGELLLREDQLLAGIWRQKSVKMQKDIKSAFGEEVATEVGLQLNKLESELVVGWGRSNPNSRRGRERRGKKKNAKH
jgi:RNA-binding protein NOB1